MTEKKAGFVAIIGRPNVGKSTLLNHLTGEKIAGVSPKPQTTREQIRGILTTPKGQIVFVDTPGMHDPKDLLGNWMMDEAKKSLEDADVILWLVLPQKPHPYESKIFYLLKDIKAPVFLLVNQVDRYKKSDVLPVLDYFQKEYPFKEFIPISAKLGTQVPLLIDKVFEYLPEGPALFPEDQISDQNERFITAEIIREKIFLAMAEEVPYATAVMVESFQEDEAKGLVKIQATIIVDKESQKGILIGKNGEMLKKMGTEARLDLEKFLDRKVFLQLWVKTMPDWKKSQQALKKLGYTHDV